MSEPENEQDVQEIEIGWRVIDPDGNVVASGPLVFAEVTSEVLEILEGEEG